MSSTCEPQESLVILFQRNMDTAHCEDIENDVRAAVTNPNMPVVFDLKGVEFVSSAFLRLCIYAHHQAGVHGFQVVNVGPIVRRVFKIAGLDAMLGGE